MTEASCLLISPQACPDPIEDAPIDDAHPEQTAILAGGCFWCTEAVFQQLDGVLTVTSGYTGGTADSANYRSVCSGNTGHAEAIRIRFDSRKLTFGQLLKVFFSIAHDPTQFNHQGNDVGPQYRSAIFPLNDAQKHVAEAYIRQLTDAQVFRSPIVTRVEPLTEFYPAEDYHQNYATHNPTQPYIAAVALPKVDKLHRYFSHRLKPQERR